MRFVDEAWIVVRSGKGGRGAVSFRREKFIPRGGPDGGDGGKGGDIVFRADPDLLTLYDLRLKRIYEARNGEGGMGRQKNGRAAEDLVIRVPVGTELYELPAPDAPEEAKPVAVSEVVPDDDGDIEGLVVDEHGFVREAPEFEPNPDLIPESEVREHEDEARLLADLTLPGQDYVACRGGRGGKGNLHFASATMRTPRFAQPGEPGEERRIRLVLKVLADVGIIGLPNAGKSTFIAAVSRARPKIAAYPFTTLTPNLGVIENDYGDRLILADIPGLIEGAHLGQGLGHRFLRHVERTRVLLHVVSAEDASPEGVFEAFNVVDEELRLFDERLAARPQLRVVNKIDLLTPEELAARKAAVAEAGQKVLFMSALTGEGVEDVLEALWQAAAPRRDDAGGEEEPDAL
ncbi:Obg family GTPase CgtA [Solidesulfovibrio sp.]|uniref:Obg family GTPase CgtA n=1 Tax=Solidesulfovibrio sp. TaxID=2910990 RepID=UPI000ED3F5FD|nr:GTPase ObgE [Solidesulfovibrio sp.]MEA5087454.1 GTPase ObgE [Solidesulfovibrio sp.]HCR13216.1 GTPase ObgE [Desulfovibrio sp.]HML61008.1 GTPase ObgE [Solidesulfovibrio sp.]